MERRLYDTARVASVLLGAGIVVLLVPLTGALYDQRAYLPLPYSVGVVVGSIAATALAAAIQDRQGAQVLFATTLAGLVAFPLVVGPGFPRDLTPAAYHLAPVAAAATCLLSRRVWASTLLLLALQAGLLCAQTAGPWHPDHRIIVGNVLFGLAVAAAGQAVLQASRATETSVASAQGAAIREFTAARSAEARTRAAMRWDAYVHDEILSVLSEIAEGSPSAGQAAREAIDRAASLRVESVPAPPLAEGLLEATLSLFPDADTTLTTTDDAVPLSPEVRLALIEATSEALRNVDRHAYSCRRSGPASVVLRHGPHDVEVVVSDRGRGFDPRHVDPSRLGILVSIQGRLDAVGGAAQVDSLVGFGTRVRLVWAEPR